VSASFCGKCGGEIVGPVAKDPATDVPCHVQCPEPAPGSLACPTCGAPYEREPDRTGLRLCRKCGGVVDANPDRASAIEKCAVRTTSGETFTGADSARLAALILRRFGGEIEAAAAAWRRMLGNGCGDADFAALAAHGDLVEIAAKREPFSELRSSALLAYVSTFESLGGARDKLDGRLWDAYWKACLALGREAKVKP